MTIPLVRTATVFDAAAATATKNLIEVGTLGQIRTARAIFLEINGGDTPNWALDIQGRVDESATWHNIDYFRTDQGAAVALSVAQLTVNWSTAQHYVIPEPPPFVRLVGTRTGGTLTVYAAFSSEAYSIPFGTVGLGAGTALIGKVGIDQTTPGTTNGVQVNAALPAGTNNIGDVDVLTLPATPAGTNLIGRVSASPETSTIYNGTTAITPVFAAISGATSGDNTLVAADATKKIRVYSLYLVAVTAVTVRFEGGAGGTALSGVMSIGANGGIVLPFNPAGWFETAVNTLLNMELGGAVQVSGGLQYGLV